MYSIERLEASAARDRLEGLIEVLTNVVDNGASVGFIAPLTGAAAREYWQDVVEEIEHGKRLLLVASRAGQIAGTVQLSLIGKPNSVHRAEVQKLLVHTRARQQGLARRLMQEIEQLALEKGRTLLVLDTRRGDIAEQLYSRAGYTRAGIIPAYTLDHNYNFEDTVIFYKHLQPL